MKDDFQPYVAKKGPEASKIPTQVRMKICGFQPSRPVLQIPGFQPGEECYIGCATHQPSNPGSQPRTYRTGFAPPLLLVCGGWGGCGGEGAFSTGAAPSFRLCVRWDGGRERPLSSPPFSRKYQAISKTIDLADAFGLGIRPLSNLSFI